MFRRYRFLRHMGCDWLTAGFIALLNEISYVPASEIRFMHIIIEMDD